MIAYTWFTKIVMYCYDKILLSNCNVYFSYMFFSILLSTFNIISIVLYFQVFVVTLLNMNSVLSNFP